MLRDTVKTRLEVLNILKRKSRYNDLTLQEILAIYRHNFFIYDNSNKDSLYGHEFRRHAIAAEKNTGILRTVTSHAFNTDHFWATGDIFHDGGGARLCENEDYELVFPKTRYLFLWNKERKTISYVIDEME